MYSTIKSPPQRAPVSYVSDGALILYESELQGKSSSLLYRLSVEPRPLLRKRESAVFYTLTVEHLRDGERTTASLRDFSSERREAEALYRRLVAEEITPEGLSLLIK